MKPSLLIGTDTHRDLARLLEMGGSPVISGAGSETAKALLLAHLLSFQKEGKTLSLSKGSTLLVTEDAARVEGFAHWLAFFEQPAETIGIPVPPSAPLKALPSPTLQQFLLLMRGERAVFLAPRAVWETEFPLHRELTERQLLLNVGKDVPFTAFVEELLTRGYEHAADQHLLPGQYRRRGDILDIFPIQSAHPSRIEFTFDRVERILAVDPMDPSLAVHGGKELTILPVTYEETALLVSQLPEESLLVLDDQDEVEPPKKTRLLRFTAFPEAPKYHLHLRYLSVLKFYTLTDFLNDLRDKLQQGWMLIIVSHRVDELEGIFREERIPHHRDRRRRSGTIALIGAAEGDLLPHSIQNPDLRCALLTDREIFSLRKAGKQRSIQKLALDFLTSLATGDYVVHMEHGIGRFEGMAQKVVDAMTREYLELTYAEGDKLFVPVDQADKLSKFVHEEGEEPALMRLGESEWKRVTEKIRQETQQVARELLELYALRAKAKGFAYPVDNEEQRAFEQAFRYEETPGQLTAIEDIKEDMEDDHPMDRLICGDVGFGKTEVAMRAAFKAVQTGKQVAVIAPITILADQHYHTFLDRMKGFEKTSRKPLQIDMLSRFRTPKEQEEILRRLKKGDIDIVIGTHRLLQPDVEFSNLGLVIVDEEQRFGVKQKERFKELRASVDILTLTATPIPRTLNLGLHKLRDITTITTPPPGRLPIITEVRKYADELVREAVLAELKRDGQVFILHNRVETIDAFADKLRALVPEATFIVAHGQLRPDDLEDRIMTFKEGRANVLVSSTIIENGIDLPRANTLIVNEAERFGLAQLYQLRGRVGRSHVQAYAYLLYHSQKLPEDAKKRLRAIVEACELGSGFQVAMRDLEIRGAGEILGVSQSGTMQTVGVSHYLRMLKNAVEELKAGEGVREEEEETVEILLPIEALIPSFYIPDEEEKISVYQKLASSEEEDVLAEFEADLREEFGEPPRQVQRLFELLRLKITCRRAGVARVKAEDMGTAKAPRREIVLTLRARVQAEDIMRLLKVNSHWRISSNTVRIDEGELRKQGGDGDTLVELTKEVSALTRPVTTKGKRGRAGVRTKD